MCQQLWQFSIQPNKCMGAIAPNYLRRKRVVRFFGINLVVASTLS
ncbi:hypothetical protein GLIP_2641 [Aliiglaciecola lipolytica E3]|uniref:Uncharacterized protein n=1 Tax=Aliiglaciecola lipolytica E3 TaxID=1127673 RepID=K6XUB9_9ALTE|nr:hypothetical protein GLIP_2641 [Aliiglaciecola lipolytica E3]